MVADVGVSRYPDGGERLQRLGQPERPRRCERFEDSITKHGEVSFPTQVRYDIVFVIGPLIVILALLCREQLLCQHEKNLKKHRDNIFLSFARAVSHEKCYRNALGCYKTAFSPMRLSRLPWV